MTLAFPKDIIFGGGAWKMSLVFNIDYISTNADKKTYEYFKVKETELSETSDLQLTVTTNYGARLDFEVLPEDDVPYREDLYVKELPESVSADDKFNITDVYGNTWGFGVVPEDSFEREPVYVKELPTSTEATTRLNVTNVYGDVYGFDVIQEE